MRRLEMDAVEGTGPSFDGSSVLTLELDHAGSLIAYFPSIGLPDTIVSQLEGALAASEAAAADAPPPEDIKCVSGAGRRQWVAEFFDVAR